MTDQRNLILAIALSTVVLFGWQIFVGNPAMEQARQEEQTRQQQQQQEQQQPVQQQPGAPAVPGQAVIPQQGLPRPQALGLSPRTRIDTPTVDGSISLLGGRFDDLRLKRYRQTPDPNSPEIELLSPQSGEHPYFAEFGWTAPQGSTAQPPGGTTQWQQVSGGSLSPGNDVVLQYDDNQGLIYTRQIAVDDRYMFTVTDRVENRGTTPAILTPYALVSRQNLGQLANNWIVHEGFIGVAEGVLQDPSYDDLGDDNLAEQFQSTGGWLGITDKYWMTTVIPPQQERVSGTFRAYEQTGSKTYLSHYALAPRTIAPGTAQEVTHRLFAGAKVNDIIEDYRSGLDIPLFDYSIDWGWFWFLTKPIFVSLDYLYKLVGNFGVAILIFTVFVKLVFFPLSNTSYRAMSKMKKLQPEMERLRAAQKDDRVAMQQGLMELYRKEKVNPVAGCLPIVVQIPVFFSLYKVLFVTIEMRHAPFFGWIRDLSAPDPTSIFNLFGLIPIDLPGFLMIGVLPILMGVTMWMQTNLNPPPADPVQARIFSLMPFIFTFMLATFPAGLVIYWTWNNILSIAQQMYIMKKSGTPIDMFDRLRGIGRRVKAGEPAQKPAGPPD